jgi:hypothetical protein
MTVTLPNHQQAMARLQAYHTERMAEAAELAPTWAQAYEDAQDLLWSAKSAEALAELAPTEYTQAYLLGRAIVLREIQAFTGRHEADPAEAKQTEAMTTN